MNNENRNDEAVSPVIATILMVAITVVLAGVLYVWASSLAGDSAGGTLDAYTFAKDDAAGTMSDAGGEALVEISMTQGTDLNWAMLKVSIKVDGGTPISCGDADSDAGCVWTAFEDASGNDQAWEAAEGITISEGSEDLCDGTGGEGGCDIQVTLTKTGTGNDADKVLGTVNAFASAN